MSFRKRNVAVAAPGKNPSTSDPRVEEKPILGTRPSPLDGRLTTSTGTRSLDTVLSGHAGLALGSSILIEENGTTDFGGVLLRYYAAEGVLQGHHVHVLGAHEHWSRELPGLSVGGETQSSKSNRSINDDKMKIAWRYERLREFGKDKDQTSTSSTTLHKTATFCHDFDLSRRVTLPSPSLLKCVPVTPHTSLAPAKAFTYPAPPFHGFLQYLISQLTTTLPTAIHRVIVPNILSPASYSPNAANPEHLLQFLHSLRALLRKYPFQLTAMLTIPLSLHPRSSGLVRWVEILSDGVLEITPFPSNSKHIPASGATSSSGSQEEPPQGMFRMHKLPVSHEKGGVGGESSGFSDDMAFNLSRRKGLVIKPYSLPPVEGDTDAQEQGVLTKQGEVANKLNIEF